MFVVCDVGSLNCFILSFLSCKFSSADQSFTAIIIVVAVALAVAIVNGAAITPFTAIDTSTAAVYVTYIIAIVDVFLIVSNSFAFVFATVFTIGSVVVSV